MRKVVTRCHSPRENPWWLTHGSGVDMVTSSIGGDKLMETESGNCRVKSERLTNGVKSKEEEVCSGVRTSKKVVDDHVDNFKYKW